jgi:hypothetical protein
MTALERHSTFHVRHHFEAVSFHAVWAGNGIEIGYTLVRKVLTPLTRWDSIARLTLLHLRPE